MTIERKLLGTSPSGGGPTDVADVFSTYVYKGTGASSQTVTNGIDLSGKGGIVWVKERTRANDHVIFSTTMGPTYMKRVKTDAMESVGTSVFQSFNSDGFTTGNWGGTGANGYDYASWTFRKKEKFFDVVTYTGNQSIRTISHGLDSPVGMLICKRTDADGEWYVQHKDVAPNKELALQSTNALPSGTTNSTFNNTAATSSVFTLGSGGGTNATGGTYVAYLFADNSSEDAEEQMIKCGAYTGSSSSVAVTLGWEPQWLMIKNTTTNSSWYMCDSMRGMPASGDHNNLAADSNAVENGVHGLSNHVQTNSTGFSVVAGPTATNTNGNTHVYMAIRAPMMVEPSAGTDVFHVESYIGDNVANRKITTGFAVDANITVGYDSARPPCLGTRINDGMFQTSSTAVQYDSLHDWIGYDNNDGIRYTAAYDFSNTSNVPFSTLSWKRAKGFFDVVAYAGNSVSGRAIPHSLGVVPEMMLVKRRTGINDWPVYHKTITAYDYVFLSQGTGSSTAWSVWNSTEPTSSVFTVGNYVGVNGSSDTYIAYLFATLDGISKVGSYTGNGSSQTISCGFSAGARFILIKRTDATGDWFVWDTTRGIVAGNDPHLSLNTSDAQVTTDDSVDPHNSGFIVNQVSATNINVSSATYIFYAIA